MLADSLAATYRKVSVAQSVLVLVLAGLFLLQGINAAMSIVVGGVAVLAGNLVYFAVARESSVSAKPAGRVLGRHLFAEVAKLLTILVILFLALASGALVPLMILAGMGVALMGHWLALLIIK